MDMTMLTNGLEVTKPKQPDDIYAYYMRGQPDADRPVSMETEIIELPKLMKRYHVLPGDGHPEAASFVRDYAEIVRSMAPPCELIAGPRIMVHKEGKTFSSKPSWLHFAKGKKPGSHYTFRTPQILISTRLTPKRPPQECMPPSGIPVDIHGRRITNLIGREQVLLRVIHWIMIEADRIWPGDDETPKWTLRVWQSLREDQDVSMLEDADSRGADFECLPDVRPRLSPELPLRPLRRHGGHSTRRNSPGSWSAFSAARSRSMGINCGTIGKRATQIRPTAIVL
ncbi:hypothetical protein [Rhizobium sp. WYCCWR 11146]|uniref:hypothetical protein n=1 Tax=Rhizobium sp. WYCCWR 11146 TaxID=2749833 RepID=UPI0015E69057|nr:hypothetical protein [Rhizobium sp. WYCCWR 11146]MBA1343903.1 hypothetical protein [Rhizobium sp. WYCCWR 11146]